MFNIFTNQKKKEWNDDTIFLHHTRNMYGIGCSINSKKAINKINKIKKRNDKKGFVILIPEINWLNRYGISVPNDIKKIMQQFWPGNLTIILHDTKNTLSHISYKGKIAIRIPSSNSLRKFIKKSDHPIISTSINISGEKPLSSKKEILKLKDIWFDQILKQDDIQFEENLKPSTIIEITDDDLLCLREGSIPISTIQFAYEKPMILFMCTANICRSPMAHYLSKKMVQDKKLNFRIASAGFLQGNHEISENSKLVLQENGIDASFHTSTQITDQIALDSWLILTMTNNHKEMLLKMDPKTENKVYTLTEYADKILKNVSIQSDVEDPYGLDISFYRNTYEIIKEKIEVIVGFLQ
ncbi:MAG: threonylcarbamoyl-AMP synthase [Candidatus Cloacimonetes bacterium]|nr:threonylcarbamoyl-AMP synthase [Candidatus Cloacimonadota bacterium]